MLSVMVKEPGPAPYYWCIALFFSSITYSLLVNHLYYRMFCGGLQQRAALLTALFKKVSPLYPIHHTQKSLYGVRSPSEETGIAP